MACCGEGQQAQNQPANQQLPGMVLARAIWGGNRTVNGMKTGHQYPRTGNGKEIWVYPEDAHAAPHMFQIVRPTLQTALPPAPKAPVLPRLEPEPEPELVLNGAVEVAAYVNENSAPVGATPQALPVAYDTVDVRADVQKVVRKAQKRSRRP